jgi:mono/diheme cytochrome c family protein
MVLGETGWSFYSYQFDESASRATLLDRGDVVPFDVTTEDGGTRTVDYQYPSPDGCAACHGTRVGEPLGPRAAQLDLRARYGSEVKNQLEALAEIGVLDLAGGMPSVEPMPDPADTSAPLEPRARAYLHSNCSHCHQPGGWTSPGVDMDLRYDKTLAETNICDVPVAFDLIPGGDYRIAAGDPESSSIYRRIQVEGVGTPTQMPPLGRSTNDPLGIELIREWILSLEDCPERSMPSP